MSLQETPNKPERELQNQWTTLLGDVKERARLLSDPNRGANSLKNIFITNSSYSLNDVELRSALTDIPVNPPPLVRQTGHRGVLTWND